MLVEEICNAYSVPKNASLFHLAFCKFIRELYGVICVIFNYYCEFLGVALL
jgi:hypothetical protein